MGTGAGTYYMARDTGSYFDIDGRRTSQPNSYTTTENNWGGASTGSSISIVNIPADTWNFIAMTQSGGTIYTFLNGILVGSQNNSSSTVSPASTPLGIFNIPGRTDLPAFNGYMAEVRYTQGVARYTASFTPPTAPFPDSA
jgi:hypothetical protein